MSQTAIEITDDMIAQAEWADTYYRNRSSRERIEEVLSSALSALHAKAGVSVKGLEWEEVPDTGGEWFQTDTGFGKYRAELVRAQKGKKWRVWSDAIRNDLPALFETLEAAKAAAQADYNARIRSALSTTLQEPDTDKNWHSHIWPGQTAQTVIKEMITVATGEYEDFEGDFDPWSCDNRADIDRWQAILSTTLAHQPVTAGWEKARKEEFIAGWKVNAVEAENELDQKYLDGCAVVDYEEWLAALKSEGGK